MGVEGLNICLHLNHMHKAIIVTAEITAALLVFQARLKHLAHKGSRKHSPPENPTVCGGKRRG